MLGLASSLPAAEPTPQIVHGRIDARLMREPAVSARQIAFVYAGDIWIVPKTGGTAVRLSSPRGEEEFPRFSPDGSIIAFSADYDGNLDIYTMPATGGLPRRLTHHGAADRVLNWYPDGKSILFASGMTSPSYRFNQLFRVSAQGGLPERLPVPYGEFGAISPDGRTLAYTPISVDFRTWKRYRGGMNPDIWFFDLEKLTARNVTHNDANDSDPMWHGGTLYFLSDRDAYKRDNLWAYDTKAGTFRQVTAFKDYDIHFPSIGPSDLVFENGGRLYVLDLATEKYHEVQIEVVTDRATLKPRQENVAGYLHSAGISPTGKRAVFEARGDLFTVPAEHGFVRNLTRSSGVAERYPAWSPDGKWIAYFSDRSGEYELTLRPADQRGAEQPLTTLGPGFRYRPCWSPDSRKIAFIDKAMRVQVYDFDTKRTTVIDRELWQYHGGLSAFRPSWSADSRWLAYPGDLDNRQSAIVLYDFKLHRRHQVTAGFYDDSEPVFDPDGKYLYFKSSRSFHPTYSELGDDSWIYANLDRLIAVPLRKDVASPLAARNDEEGEKKEEKNDGDKEKKNDVASSLQFSAVDDPGADEALTREGRETAVQPEGAFTGPEQFKARSGLLPLPAGEGPGAGPVDLKRGSRKDTAKKTARSKDGKPSEKEKKPKPVEIDLADFERRAVVLPPKAGRYANLEAAPGKLIYRRLPRAGAQDGKSPVLFWDLDKREEKTIVDDADDSTLSADHQKLLVRKDGRYSIIEAKEGQKLDKKLATSDFETTIDPVAEWRQIFTDAWRLERDYFYDPGLHGVDWNAMRRRYGQLLADAVTRWDVNYVIGELIAELNSSHTYRSGGDVETGPQRGVGYLGADFALEHGAYRIKHIIEDAPWDLEVRSPLRQSGTNVVK
ncbi:MAG: PD40 domain-containing protein, partial [Verrucomicrobia bacterium]|nr:PD40 domain-containing protein [Verrucomicrobiota bacterium]